MTKNKFWIVLPAILLSLVFIPEAAEAQVKYGKYTLVGASTDGGGFYGIVTINKAGPLSAKLNTGETFRGRIDAKGKFIVTSLSGPGYVRVASGSATMRSRSYAIGKYKVRGEAGGYFMLGLN